MLGVHLPEVVYGANDGIVTTFAIVSGVVGSGLDARVILILGFANVVADGISMGASKYLSARSETAIDRVLSRQQAVRLGAITLAGFVVAGVVPLAAYVVPIRADSRFTVACVLAAVLLFGIGAGRSLFTERSWFRSGAEMLLVGAAAGLVAYLIGAAVADVMMPAET